MSSASDKRDGRKMWERKEFLVDFSNVSLACDNVGVFTGRFQATLIPVTVELGDEDIAIKHFRPRKACSEEVGVRNEDSGDFSSGTDPADALHEFDRDKAATVPDDYTSFGEK